MNLAAACLLSLSLSAGPELKRFEAVEPHMGTMFAIVVYAPDKKTAEACFGAAFCRVAELNEMLSDYEPESELSLLSASSPTETPIAVSEDLFRVLDEAKRLSVRSNGAFDVTVGPLTKLWRRARRRKQLPDERRLAEARAAVGYQHMKLTDEGKAVELLKSGMRLDLGGIAKGYAADEALRVTRSRGVSRVLINAGGDVVIGDPPPGDDGWQIGVAALEPDAPPSRFLTLSNCSVATSGDVWQYVEIGDERYSHILDPHTGLGLTTRRNVTIIAPTGIEADSLASAVSVLGPQEGFALIDKVKGAAGLIVEKTASGIRTHETRTFGREQ